MEKIIDFEPAFDRRDPDPKKNYGVHGVSIRFVLKGEKGAVQFLLYTGWLPKKTQEEYDKKYLREGLDETTLRVMYHPLPADLGVHSKEPLYEGHRAMGELSYKEWKDETMPDGTVLKVPDAKETGTFNHCEYTDGKCYYDGSGLAADEVFGILLDKGSDGVWEFLENYYKNQFGELK